MSFTEIPLAEYINIEEEMLTLYIYTKDKRVLAFKDVVSNLTRSHNVITFSHVMWEKVQDVAMFADEFSYLEYTVARREQKEEFDYQKEFDDINSFLDDEIEKYNKPKPFVQTIVDEMNNLTEDLI